MASGTIIQNPAVATFSGASSVNKTYGSACTNGSLLVAMATQEVDAGTFTISDPTNGTWANDKTQASGAGGNPSTGTVRSIQNTATTALTVTCTVGTSGYGTLSIFEETGMATSTPVDVTGGAGGAATTATMSMTTGTANCTVYSCGAGYGSASPPDTNYTTHFGPTGLSNAYHQGEYRQDAGAAGGITLTHGWTGTPNTWMICAVAYKPAGGAATTRGTPFGHRGTAFNGGRTFHGIIQ